MRILTRPFCSFTSTWIRISWPFWSLFYYKWQLILKQTSFSEAFIKINLFISSPWEIFLVVKTIFDLWDKIMGDFMMGNYASLFLNSIELRRHWHLAWFYVTLSSFVIHRPNVLHYFFNRNAEKKCSFLVNDLRNFFKKRPLFVKWESYCQSLWLKAYYHKYDYVLSFSFGLYRWFSVTLFLQNPLTSWQNISSLK